ncbi:MAG: PLP-dependent aminotransferase family protein [Alphaproteobacteria bacterium]|nr:PLP-dependent aminotransferase family protein [Alphaproteobacteria bacterium]
MRSRYRPRLPKAGPRGRALVRALTEDARTGRLQPGERLPGSRSLAEALGLSRNTVVTALEELAAEGWLVARPGAGFFVAQDLPLGGAPPVTPSGAPGFPLPPAPAHVPLLTPRSALPYRLLGGEPDLRLLPLTELSRAYGRVLRGRGRRLVGYGDPRGELRLRRALGQWLAENRGLSPRPEGLLPTRGSQMALYLIAQALLRPGDRVAVERYGYPPAWAALRSAGAELVPIEVDEDGLVVESLPEGLRAVYLTPHHQFPTGAVLSPARRLRLLRLAAERGVALIEDDYDHEFHFDGAPIWPLASADPASVVLYVGTLSKAFAPGIRLGWIAAPPPVIERLAALRAVIDRQGDRVVEQAVAELIEDGLLSRHVRRLRRQIAGRKQALEALVAEQLPGLRVHRRPGGLALWCEAPGEDAEAWAARALTRGVYLETGASYRLAGPEEPFLRLGFAPHTPEELTEAVRRLAACRAPA